MVVKDISHLFLLNWNTNSHEQWLLWTSEILLVATYIYSTWMRVNDIDSLQSSVVDISILILSRFNEKWSMNSHEQWLLWTNEIVLVGTYIYSKWMRLYDIYSTQSIMNDIAIWILLRFNEKWSRNDWEWMRKYCSWLLMTHITWA